MAGELGAAAGTAPVRALQRLHVIPLVNTLPRYDMWLLERYGLPARYWPVMPRKRS